MQSNYALVYRFSFFVFVFVFVLVSFFAFILIVHSWFIRVLIITPLIAGVGEEEERIYSGVYLSEVADSFSMYSIVPYLMELHLSPIGHAL